MFRMSTHLVLREFSILCFLFIPLLHIGDITNVKFEGRETFVSLVSNQVVGVEF